MATTLFIIVMLILLVAVLCIGCLFLLGMVGMVVTRVPFVPSAFKSINEAEKLLGLTNDSVVYDLGCGNGRALYHFAAHYPGAKMYGYEIAPLPYLLSQIIGLYARAKNVKIFWKSFSHANLRDATHVYLYLFPEVIAAMEPKLIQELKSGTKVVICDFPFPTRVPDTVVKTGEGLLPHTLYLYTF